MLTTALYIISLLVWLLTILLLLRFKWMCKALSDHHYPTVDDEQLPPLTVIVTTRNQAYDLRQNLPLILNQIYPKFEVIVVDINSTDDTQKLQEQLEADNITLRHSFTPATGRDISKQRLAITLGVKAATYGWFVLTDATCCPVSHLWLRRIGECIAGHRSAEIVLGYTRYKSVNDYASRRLSFHTLWRQLLNFGLLLNRQNGVSPRNLKQRSGAYYASATNLAYKKELFLSHQGFASGSNLLEGATEIMVNQNSTCHNTAICLQADAIIEQEMPRSANHWTNKRLFFYESQQHFTHKLSFRVNNAALMLTHLMMALCMTATIVTSTIFADYIVVGAAVVLWAIHFAVQGMLANAISRNLNNRPISPFTTAWFTHLLPFWGISTWARYIFADKNQFRKKYI